MRLNLKPTKLSVKRTGQLPYNFMSDPIANGNFG